MKLKASRKLFLVAAVSMISGAMVVYAATTLFTQTFPSQTFATPTLVQGSTCSGGSLVLDTTASTIPAFSGEYSQLVYGCDSAGDAAFVAQGGGGTSLTVTPTFTAPLAYGYPWTVAIDTTTDPSGLCKGTSTTAITSTSPITLPGGNSYVYCLTANPAASFTSFSITWSD